MAKFVPKYNLFNINKIKTSILKINDKSVGFLTILSEYRSSQNLIRMSSMAFWDCYLKDNDEAKHWLAEGGFESALGEDGTFEKKIK